MSIVFKDEFQGVGGSYVMDPKSGLRKQVQGAPADAGSLAQQAEIAAAKAELAKAEKILAKDGVKA